MNSIGTTSEPPLLQATGNKPLAVSTASKIKAGVVALLFRKSVGESVPRVVPAGRSPSFSPSATKTPI